MKFLSHVWSIARGSVGGITYTAGRNHQLIARQRTSPVQPNTTPQVQMRQAWAAAEALWRVATTITRQQWSLYADLVVYQGPLGSYTLTGRQRFLATLALAFYMNDRFGDTITATDAVPVTAGWFLVSRLKLLAPVAVGIGFSISLTNDEVVDGVVLVNVSQVLPDTRNFWKGPWDDSKTFTFDLIGGAASIHDILGLQDGKKYFVRIRVIGDNADHRISEPAIISGFAEETVI